MYELAKDKPCADCGGQFAPEAMDFDHRPGTDKLDDVGKLVSGRYSWDKVQAEIAKCDLVCANCHRIRTKQRLNEDPDFPPFEPFPKIPRLNRDVVLTEKLDGTNAVIVITESGDVIPGSKSRWLRPRLSKMGPDPDNMGFAAWVQAHEEELFEGLGPGVHAGEWWGKGVQKRHYNLDHKRFSLFNRHRWNEENVPACCHVVPILWQGNYKDLDLREVLDRLREGGSVASPGWMDPEGVVLFHTAAGTMFKILLQGDELPKGITTRKEREVAAALAGEEPK